MIPTYYYRVCDKCGTVHSVVPSSDAPFSCDSCGAAAAWEFAKIGKAFDMQAQIREARGIVVRVA